MDSLSDSSAKAGSSVKGAKDSIDDLGNASTKTGSNLKGTESAVDGVSDSASRAGSSIKNTSDSLDNLGDSGANTSKNLKGTDSAIDSVADSSTNASQSVKNASDSLSGLSDSGADATKGLKGADSAIDGVADSSANAQSGVKGVSDSLDGLSESGARAGRDIKGADDTIDGLSDSSANASQGLKGTSDSLDGMSDSATNAAQSAKNVNDETSQMDGQSQKASIGFKNLASSLGLVAIASAAFDVLKQSMDQAISRFDTLNQFPKVLGELGVSAEEAERATSKLSDGIEGLPTTLDDISASAQEMYTSFNDIDKATDTALALNNALLGSGASAEQAKRGTQQYNKALQTGKFDMMTWNTLNETMGVGLVKVAENMGYAGKSAKNDLYKALQSGEKSLDDFNDALIEVGTGTGIMAKLAKENSKGIATSLTNLKNTAAKGIANIIQSFDKLSVAVTGNDIAENIDQMKHVINASFDVIQGVIEATIPFFQGFADVVRFIFPLVEALTPAILGLASAYVALLVVKTTLATLEKFALALQSSTAIVKLYEAAVLACNTVLKAYTGQITLAMAAEKAYAVVQGATKAVLAASTLAYNTMTGAITLAEAAKIALAGATKILNTALTALSGPVGWITLGIGALVGATVGIVKWFNKSSEEAEILGEKNESLAESVEDLNESVNNSASAYQEQKEEIDSSAEANMFLAEKVEELAEKENKSAEEKAMLNGYVEKLNENVDDLNLAYDEETDALNMSSEAMQEKIDLMAEQASYEAALERQVEIAKEQHEVDAKLKETNGYREDLNERLEEGSLKKVEHAVLTKALDEQEQELTETEKQLGEQQKITEEQVTESMQAIAEATEGGVATSKEAIEEWIEKNEDLVNDMNATYNEIYDITTNAFEKISEESRASADEMIENLQHNQEMTEEWGTNISELYEYASKNGHEGFLHWLEQLGPDSAAEIAEISSMSDSQLEEFAELMDSGADVATDSFKESLGEGLEDSFDAMKDIITETPATLKESVEASDFESVGKAMTDGAAEGVDDGSADVEESARKMGENVTKAAKNILGIHSPSTVFAEIGSNITQGLVEGVQKGSSKVKKAINDMFKTIANDSKNSFKHITQGYEQSIKQIEKTLMKLPKVTKAEMQKTNTALKTGSAKQFATMVKSASNYTRAVKTIRKALSKLPTLAQKSMSAMTARLRTGSTKQRAVMKTLATGLRTPFNGISGKFRTIGVNAMSGLRGGLNAGRSSVMSTARNIANSVSATMKRSLKIKSPSRVMKDDVGKWIPEGIALGIKDNAKSVFKELDNLSGGMVVGSPEQALGVNSMAYNTGSQFVDAIKNLKMPSGNKQGNKQGTKQPAVINVHVGGRRIASEIVDDLNTIEGDKIIDTRLIRGYKG